MTAAWLVRALHMLFVSAMILAPWSAVPRAVVAHAIVTPILWLHWYLNDDTCFLTLVESKLRGIKHTSSFFHTLVNPVYKIADDTVRKAAWTISGILWAVSLWRLTGRFTS